jgi:cytochrome c peroxidase
MKGLTMTREFRVLLAIVVGAAMYGCAKEEDAPSGALAPMPDLPAEPYSYVLPPLPDHFNSILLNIWESTPDDNHITDAGATLGRVLFYDRSLSANNSISCGSCHKQEAGFADPRALSVGHLGGATHRNAMHLVNQFYVRAHFWDERAPSLEAQVLMPIQDAVEMGMTLDGLTQRLRSLDYYAPLFMEAFGDDTITSDRISRALAQFVRSMASYRTRYDEGFADDFAQLTQIERDGKALFFNGQTRCNHCHMTVNFFNHDARNNGLDVVYADNGLGALTGDPADNGKFKVPSLRNVELTAPYMHDGRFNTLEEVVEHYNSGVQQHPNLDDRLTVDGHTGGIPVQLGLSEYDKQALVAFMKTLTDTPMITDVRFSDPFR